MDAVPPTDLLINVLFPDEPIIDLQPAMRYELKTPCADCPFRVGTEHGYTDERLADFASGPFPCHRTAVVGNSGGFEATKDSLACAGALIWQEKREAPNQMTWIAERLGLYDRTILDMDAPVR